MGRRLHRFLKSEQLESRRPLAADLAALDVNDDMYVSALDALIIVNDINQRAAGNSSAAEAEAQLDCDINDDGAVTPVDVLNVINQINSGIVVVPTDTTDSTVDVNVVVEPGDTTDGTSSTDDSTSTDDSAPAPDDSTPDVTDGTTTDDPTTDDSTTDDSDTSDDSTDEPSDSTDPADGTDSTQPDDSTDDSTGDDTSDGTTDDDDTSTGDHADCDHVHGGRGIGDALNRALSIVSSALQQARHGHHGRGDIFADLDANGDGALSSDEVGARLWDRLSPADADGSDSVTEEELQAYREAQRVAAVEAFFEKLDSDGSGAITSSDVSRMTWRFISRADANSDDAVTVDELLAVPGRWR